MSKRYEFKVIESDDSVALEKLLAEAGAGGWSAVGYGVLPDSRRSVLLERKAHGHKHHAHGVHHHSEHHDHRHRADSSHAAAPGEENKTTG